jgi:argininosuccinate synthase
MIAFCADLGQGEELSPVDGKARAGGASAVYIEDLREEFVRDFVFPMLRAGAVYESGYLLGTSIARPLIAKRQIEIARGRTRRRRGRPRRDRQGQRPGALRADRLRARARHPGHRAVAHLGVSSSRTDLIEYAEATASPCR